LLLERSGLRTHSKGDQNFSLKGRTSSSIVHALASWCANGTMVLRWTAAGVLEAERGFHKVAGHRGLANLVAALRALHAALERITGKIDVAKTAA